MSFLMRVKNKVRLEEWEIWVLDSGFRLLDSGCVAGWVRIASKSLANCDELNG
jgi:hypothetical protein